MRLSIFAKLFVSILLVCIASLSVMTLMINSSFKTGLQGYLNDKEIAQAETLVENVKAYYSDKFGWRRLEHAPHIWASLIGNLGEIPPPPGKPRERLNPPRVEQLSGAQTAFVPFGVRVNLLDTNGQSVAGMPENTKELGDSKTLTKLEVMIDNKVVGYVSIVQSNELSGELAESFFEQQTHYVFVIVSITILLSFIIAFFMVRHFLNPLKALSEGAQSIAEGELDFHIEAKGTDELADLIRTFNGVVASLKSQKEIREQWLSDISHELRTPIAVLRSELEAMQDGIRKPEPRYIDSLHNQVLTLGKLVDDLHQLSLTDSGMNIDLTSKVELVAIVDSVAYQCESRLAEKNISLVTSFDELAPIDIKGDAKYLSQLFTNLLENTYRYTDAGGSASIAITEKENQVQITFEDSTPGVPEESLGHLFERLYRVDKSRSRLSGGSGLGLAICENIVHAHGGTVSAGHSELGGLKIIITLPKDAS
ncbi:ATP-binding protein [Vibrio hannami]|uniref:ATP-binding protein n=1 Tax=Vibrio hannami TaxID=2717094 RepID=UPI00240F460F|nr:ATP-binding protein [Vibrio hannami]MDG3085925.1 ATP-binding protein [Vibrio hannami]